jgi:hypothetical protein
VRHACDVQTVCQPTDEPAGEPLPLRVSNVSLGGLSGEAPRPFVPGELLSVRLPGGEAGPTTVLACVIRTDDLGAGRWKVGCTFSAEITEAELLQFEPGAGRVRVAEQRAAERFDCAAQATYQRVNGPASAARPAAVANLSLTGVALRAAEPLPPGELLGLELRGPGGCVVAGPLACVVRVTAEPGGAWLFGCNFLSELSEEQLHSLL